jgi:hypothetical protein
MWPEDIHFFDKKYVKMTGVNVLLLVHRTYAPIIDDIILSVKLSACCFIFCH